ncbi:TonB-dependent receptor [Pontibacter sp. E15-1]|uniref:SusC/RagA family TonB-linked outer membrane protein n=1 Tax=Pontibacter sp. E15-1 TaxID=2919918 RepID=UPI001F4FBB95|nr:TonB-dependent receptor [Pontibacter sp. E15-1]MCJ8165780.1 TonB-dependent receptor [Pontibacter sp. E15-1]
MKNSKHTWRQKGCLLALLMAMSGSGYSAALPAEKNAFIKPVAWTVSGKVVAKNGEPLPGVTVLEKGTANGTATAADGSFSLSVAETPGTLVFSYIGYANQQVPYSGPGAYNVTLLEDARALQELVVVGYSAQKEATITGAVAPVNMKDVETRRVPSVSQALQGQVAGVQVTQSTGAPGDEINIRIRGTGTIGNNDPLFVIDGVPSRELSFLNPNDIASMTVLKDAAAASMYGSRAAGGVVVITTKSGIKGKSSIDVNYFNGVQMATNLPDMLNATQYMNKVEEAWNNAGYSGTNPYTADKGRADFADTDWLDELFEVGRTQNIQLSANGGTDKIQYFLSSNYYSQDGIVVYGNDKFQRYNVRANVTADLTNRLKVGTNIQLSYTSQDKLSSKGDAPGIIRHAMLRPPILSVFKDPSDPTYTPRNPFTDLPFYNSPDDHQANKYEYTSNPIALAFYTDDKRKQFKTFGNMFGEYALLQDKALKFRTNLGVDLNFFHNKAFGENFGDDNGGGSDIDKGQGRNNRPNSLAESRGEVLTLTWNNTLNYTKEIGRHSINALVGSEYIKNHGSTINASRSRYDFTSDAFRYIDFGSTAQNLWNGGSGSEWGLFSLFGSATYVYNDRYMVTTNLRADASSRFAENNQWGYFPSVSAGWMVSEESFMDGVDWLSDLKLRASWGQLGNQEIDNYAYLTLLRRDADRYLVSRYGNPDLKWETTTQANVGIDLGLFNNKLYVSADYFDKLTSDILLPISLPALVGEVSPTIVNAGEVSNKGFELGINFRDSDHAFKYSVNANMATVVNEVQKLHPNLPNIAGSVTKTQVGQPLNAYYGYVMDGIYQNNEEILTHLYGTTNPSALPGDIRFADLDGNGIINDKDRDFIGNPNPKLSYGLNLHGEYKGFDLSVFFQGVEGVDRYNDSKKIVDYDTRPFNYTTRVLDSWNGEGSSNTIPRVSFSDNGSSRVSSIYVEDASYLRFKNLELGYTLKNKFNIGMESLRFYVSAQNLFTITDYTGLDPESVDLIDFGTYPQSRSLLMGINAKF